MYTKYTSDARKYPVLYSRNGDSTPPTSEEQIYFYFLKMAHHKKKHIKTITIRKSTILTI